MTANPGQSGFMMPAEWEKHSAVWLAWPHNETAFPRRMREAEEVFAEMVKHISQSEEVKLIVRDAQIKEKVTGLLKNKGSDISRIKFITAVYDDVWIRDYGPIFLVNKENRSKAWVKAKYNGYGKADDPYYTTLLLDDDVFNNIDIGFKKFDLDIVLEGGAIDQNGEGLCLATEQTLLNPNRNPGLSREDTEKYLGEYLGVQKVIWLKEGLVNDHTDGHIDEIARFVAPNKIVCAHEDNPADENYKILDDNFKVLETATDVEGRPFEIIKLPMPHMRYEDGAKAPVSYCNFYVGNEVVLMPKFSDPNDKKAQEILQNCFPERKVVAIDCRDIIYGGGGIHCMTKEEPAV